MPLIGVLALFLSAHFVSYLLCSAVCDGVHSLFVEKGGSQLHVDTPRLDCSPATIAQTWSVFLLTSPLSSLIQPNAWYRSGAVTTYVCVPPQPHTPKPRPWRAFAANRLVSLSALPRTSLLCGRVRSLPASPHQHSLSLLLRVSHHRGRDAAQAHGCACSREFSSAVMCGARSHPDLTSRAHAN
jgi:hypothetical protein